MEFGPHTVPLNNVIYKTQYTYVFVNLMPLSEGHILVSSIRKVPNFHNLTQEEKIDFLKVTYLAGNTMKKHLKTEALNLTIQDGPAAGQTVPHVYCHIVPHNIPANFERKYPDDKTREETANQYRQFFEEELKKATT